MGACMGKGRKGRPGDEIGSMMGKGIMGRPGDEIGSMMGFEYSVFLNFRGPDTREGITDHLHRFMSYVGIWAFKDDKEFRRGEEIGGELERAINESKIYIVIFSKDYASSVWCLRELAMMVDRRRESSAGEKVILPIFYGVDPDDVKQPTGLYHRAIDKLKNEHGPEVVQKWKEALSEVCRIGGWDAKNINGDGKLVELVVQEVIGILKLKYRSLPKELIEIDDRVDELTKLLNLDSHVVQFIVVYGMGGIGKTTLASIIFNKLSPCFPKRSFLSDVRAKSSKEKGIVKLQEKLLHDILGDKYPATFDSNEGIGEIKRRLRGKRLLVVLDDVDKRDQIEKLFGSSDWFGPGTRIIITSRDNGVVCGLVSSGIDYFEMKEMDDDRALRLFARHAFVNNELPDEYVALSKEIASAVGNLPLALEVIGSSLCQFKRSKEAWEETLTKLKLVPKKKVYERLKVSYDGLEDDEQEIFLDIACLSDQVPKMELVYVWQARSLSHVCGLEALVKKSLIKILPDDTFWMHDQLQGMGKEIVRQKGNGSLGMRSRLWDPEDAREVVHQKKGTDKVLAINLGVLPDEHELAREEFEGMSNLRFLRLTGGQFIGDFGNFLTKLMWLHWEDCRRGPNVAFFNTNNLAVLKISGRGITYELMKDLRMGNLRSLEICNSSMTTMPDLSWCSKLERIIFKDCYRLKTLHSSVGELKDLTSLNIAYCKSLRSLPELGSAKALQELSLIGCKNVEELPESLGDLRVLRVRETKIRKLPASIGNLTSLKVLEFHGSLPQESSVRRRGLDIVGLNPIKNLASLSRLELGSSAIGNLPDAFAELVSLEFLSVVHSKMRSLPNSVSDLKLLAELRLSNTDIEELPGSIGRLENLRVLNLYCSKIRKLPTSIGNLKRLEELDASGCPLDEGIPEEIGGLSALITLSIEGSRLRQLPGSIGKLSTLQSLCLDRCDELLELPTTVRELSSLRSLCLCGCYKLQELPEIPTGLSELEVMLGSLQPVPNLSLLTDLTKLRLYDSYYSPRGMSQSQPVQLSWLGELRKLKILVLILMGSPIVLPPDMSSLTRLETLQLSFCLPWARCSEMRFLHRLDFSNSSLKEIPLSGLDMLENLRDITVKQCEEVVTLLDLASLRQVRTLELSGCPKLVDISGVERMAQLEVLDIWYCKSIQNIPDLSNLRMMEKLSIQHCHSLLNPPNVNGECWLNISNCRGLRDFGGRARNYASFCESTDPRFVRFVIKRRVN